MTSGLGSVWIVTVVAGLKEKNQLLIVVKNTRKLSCLKVLISNLLGILDYSHRAGNLRIHLSTFNTNILR